MIQCVDSVQINQQKVQLSQKLFSLKTQLTQVAAIEHLTAILADGVLDDPAWMDGADAEYRKRWQFTTPSTKDASRASPLMHGLCIYQSNLCSAIRPCKSRVDAAIPAATDRAFCRVTPLIP